MQIVKGHWRALLNPFNRSLTQGQRFHKSWEDTLDASLTWKLRETAQRYAVGPMIEAGSAHRPSCTRLPRRLTAHENDQQDDGPHCRDRGRHRPPGGVWFLEHVVPNFYFHLTHTYAILRHNHVPLGKRDYLGGLRLKA